MKLADYIRQHNKNLLWALSWDYVLRKGWLTHRQLREAEEFAQAAVKSGKVKP